jgi:hypothetical protein
MVQIGRDADLAQEAIGAKHRAELRVQDFHGDSALMLEVAREKDRCHAAATELALDLVPAAERLAQLGEQVCHGANVRACQRTDRELQRRRQPRSSLCRASLSGAASTC